MGAFCLELPVLPVPKYLFWVQEAFSRNFIKYIFNSFLSLFSFWDPIMQVLEHVMTGSDDWLGTPEVLWLVLTYWMVRSGPGHFVG